MNIKNSSQDDLKEGGVKEQIKIKEQCPFCKECASIFQFMLNYFLF